MVKEFQLVSILSILILVSSAFSQEEALTVSKVRGNIYMLTGPGGNIGISVGDDGILIVDDKFAASVEGIRSELEKLGKGDLKFVLNTHFHGDHTGGNEAFGHDATIVAHTNVRKRLADEGQAARALPVITFDESASVHFNGEEIKLIHVSPSHTDSDSVVYFTGSNVIHMGDLFFNGRFPFVDLGSGGDVANYLENVEKLLREAPDDVLIIPGHGPLATVEDLKAFDEALSGSVAAIRKEMAAGKSLEEIRAGDALDAWPDRGENANGFDRWIEYVYESYSR